MRAEVVPTNLFQSNSFNNRLWVTAEVAAPTLGITKCCGRL